MELKQLWSVISRRWWLILLPAVVALVLTIPTLKVLISPPVTYNVTIRFTASQSPTADNAKTFQDKAYIPWLASEYAVTNLATWIKTESFAREMVNNLKNQNPSKTFDIEAIRGALASDSARSIITMSITWPDPDEIKVIAQAGIDVLQTQNVTYFAQFGKDPASVTPLDAITVAPIATQVTTRFQPLLKILLGLAVGIALAFLAEYLDPTLRNRQEIESLGFSIISEIPNR